MQILTTRFLLRDFVPADVPAFEAYHADPRTLELYGPAQATPGHAKQLLDLFRIWAEARPRLNYQLAIVRRDDVQILIGCCGLRTANTEPGKAELGIEMAPAYWGRYKYAIEVMQALIEFGFGTLELQEIYGRTVSANSRIGRLVASFGATAVNRPTPLWIAAKGWRQIEWKMTREHWENNHPPKYTS